MTKKRIATVSLAGCFGCHMSLLDIDERLIELMKLVDLDRSPFNDLKKFTKHCDIGFIEGGCCNEENVHTLQEFRKNCDVLVAVGQCAIMGGLPALRNAIMHSEHPLRDCFDRAYSHSAHVHNPSNHIPNDPALPLLLDRVYTCAEVVNIDYQIPGCPPSADAIWYALDALIHDRPFKLNYNMIEYD